MRIEDLRDGEGRLFAFEVSTWLGRYGTLQVARTIPGVRILSGAAGLVFMVGR